VSGIAHEMNNPANSILGNAGFLKKFIDDIKIILFEYMNLELPIDHKIINLRKEKNIDTELNEIDNLVKYVNDGALRISEIVTSLRSYAHVHETMVKKADIHKGIEDTLFLLNNKLKDKIEVVKKFGNIPQIECKPGQINQVFMNVLSNAIDAIPGKGTITIETFLKNKEQVIVKISDSGIGIPKENLSHIFEPFFTTKETDKGTGLGLSISHSIINDHNGRIIPDQNVSEETAFIIELPINQKKIMEELKHE
jgi:two-component system, NtrC family, sensor kinase